MAGESKEGESPSAAWSKQDLAAVAIVLLGIGPLVSAGVQAAQIALVYAANGFGGITDIGDLLRQIAFLGAVCLWPLLVSIFLVTYNRKIASVIFRRDQREPVSSAPQSARRAALIFGVRVCCVFLAAQAVSNLVQVLPLPLLARHFTDIPWYSRVYLLVGVYSMPVGMLAAYLLIMRWPGWLVSFAQWKGETDEDAGSG